MAQASVTQQAEQEHYPFLPLTVRMAHDEAYWLARELQSSEQLSRLEAESRAVRMVRELDDYRDEWDRLAYIKGNKHGLAF